MQPLTQKKSPQQLQYKENYLTTKLKESQISFWIDSSGGPKKLCKNSFYGINPKYYFYGSLDKINFVNCNKDVSIECTYISKNCFDFLEEKLNEEENNPDGIFIGYISYDLYNNLLLKPHDKIYPDFFFAYCDNAEDVIASSSPQANLEARRERSSETTKQSQSHEPFSIASDLRLNDVVSKHLNSNMTDAEYLNKVKQIKEEIRQGNVYQVNLTREYSIEIDNFDELDLYLKLRSISPNPYGGYFKTPFVSILSSSPEEFLYIAPSNQTSRYVRTRPIKGTLPKNTFEIDSKNQAENTMIVDLERNDLGRICEYGSIKTNELLTIEPYKHLNHVVSTVEGKLRSDLTLRQIFEAMFPGGSITGAPKIAAMKIINELEPTKRGGYTGSFGYIKTDGTMNFNILIRTIFIHGNKITFNVGGGIIADSEAEMELEEINLKAKGIIATLGL